MTGIAGNAINPVRLPGTEELEHAHRRAVGAAVAGMSDSGLRTGRLTGSGVPVLAEAAVSSATPFLRAPLLARISSALRLHPPGGESFELCPSCGELVPCSTARVLRW